MDQPHLVQLRRLPNRTLPSTCQPCQRGCPMIRVDPAYTTVPRQPCLPIWQDTCQYFPSPFSFSLSQFSNLYCHLLLSLSCNISPNNKLKNKQIILMLSGTRASSSHSQSDRMVKVELEAAEALACLAHSSVVMEARATKSVSRRRVKNKSLVAEQDSASHPLESVPPPSPSDHAEDRIVVVQQHGEMICNMMTKPIQAEQDDENQPNHVGSSTYAPSIGSKSRQSLNEAEKEARRVCRVLANRESARQTIRRRQALYEELTRKAADLAWENENLKKEKEAGMKEYDSLRSANESLKAQITNIMKVEVEETREDLKLSNTEIGTSPSTSYPVYVYNQPSLLPLFWPSIIPPSNVVQFQCVPQNGIAIPSQVPVLTSDEPYSSPEQGNLTRINVPGTPFYVLPCPNWLFPFSHRANGIHPQSFDLPDKQNKVLLNNQSRASASSKTIAHIENHHGFQSMKIRSEASNSAEPISANNLQKNPFSLLPDGDGQHLGPQSRRGVLVPAPLSHVRPAVTVEYENIPRPNLSCGLEGTSAAAGYVPNGVPEINQEPVVCPSKKQMDAVTAAEARKRRKELTKLKNLHYRQFRMPY